jgi:hypothetical protein
MMRRHRFRADGGRRLQQAAHELQQAAGGFQEQAGDPAATPTSPVAVAHVEEALNRLENGLVQMADVIGPWCDTRSEFADQSGRAPEAAALRWHLLHAARALQTARHACAASRQWSRRLVGAEVDPHAGDRERSQAEKPFRERGLRPASNEGSS